MLTVGNLARGLTILEILQQPIASTEHYSNDTKTIQGLDSSRMPNASGLDECPGDLCRQGHFSGCTLRMLAQGRMIAAVTPLDGRISSTSSQGCEAVKQKMIDKAAGRSQLRNLQAQVLPPFQRKSVTRTLSSKQHQLLIMYNLTIGYKDSVD
jgi:hypothetical protein